MPDNLPELRKQIQNAVPAGAAHRQLVLCYPSAQHRLAVQLHDLLTYLGFAVVPRQYAPLAGAEEAQRVQDALPHSFMGVLLLPASPEAAQIGDQEITGLLQAFAAHATTQPEFRVAVLKSGATPLPAPAGGSSSIALDSYNDEPTWSKVLAILEVGLRQPWPEAIAELAAAVDRQTTQTLGLVREALKESNEKKKTNVETAKTLVAKGDDLLSSPALACKAANGLISLKEPEMALRFLERVANRFPDAVRVRQLKGLAQRRCHLEQAWVVLDGLWRQGWRDPETAGIFAGYWMDSYARTKNLDHLRKSRDLYKLAFERCPTDTYVGINAATKTALLSGKDEAVRLEAVRIADQVDARLKIIEEARKANKGEPDYWLAATAAEVQLLKKNYVGAGNLYMAAVAIAKDEIASHESTWLQAQRVLEAFGAPEQERKEIAAAFANLGPSLELAQEVRLAVVMYGGVSLAIYINGVVQELLNLVRATAPVDTGGARQSVLPDELLTGTERIYRKLARMVPDVGGSVEQFAPVRTRFVVDIISGTSAGGINGVFLAKALASGQPLEKLKDLWFQEADFEKLINDRRPVAGAPTDAAPKSLLDGRHMYRKLLEALNGMGDGTKTTAGLVCAEELDLFVTATDLNGLILTLPTAPARDVEKRHRNVFHFRHTPERTDFVADNDPFLAFAARATSAFPFAFEPMRLKDLDALVPLVPPYDAYTAAQLEALKKGWQSFYADYLECDPDTGEVKATGNFSNRPFADGGYLDNKPFSHAVRSLLRRRADGPVQRKLIYIEPAPEELIRSEAGSAEFNVVENVLAALVTLPGYETIREELEAVRARNHLVRQMERVTDRLLSDVEVWQKRSGGDAVPPPAALTNAPAGAWGNEDLTQMIRAKGVAYGGYHRLKVAEVTDELAEVIAAAAGFRADGPLAQAVTYLVRVWVRENYVESLANPPGNEPTQNQFLVDFDIGYRMRRLYFVLARIDALANLDDNSLLQVLTETQVPLPAWQPTAQGHAELTSAVLAPKPNLSAELRKLQKLRGNLHRRPTAAGADAATANPLGDVFQGLAITLPKLLQELPKIAAASSDAARLDAATACLLVPEFGPVLATIARRLAAILKEPMIAAASGAKEALDPAALADVPLPFERAARTCLWHYYQQYEDYDQVMAPILSQTGLGELAEVDVLRFSPVEAGEKGESARLAGTAFANFGGFLNETWRRNDLLLGRLHAVERLLKVFLPEQRKKCEDLLKEAHTIILTEELQIPGNHALAAALLTALGKGEKGEVHPDVLKALRELKQPHHGATFLKPDKLHDYFSTFKVSRELDPKMVVRLFARGTQVVGKMLETLADGYKVKSTSAKWITRLGLWFWALVEAAVPGSLAHHFVRHWIGLLYLFEFTLLVGATALVNPVVQHFAFVGLVLTAGVHVVLLVLGDVIDAPRRKSFFKETGRMAYLTGVVAILWFASLGIFAAWFFWIGASPDDLDKQAGRLRLVGFLAGVILFSALVARGLLGRLEWRELTWKKNSPKKLWQLVAASFLGVVVAAAVLCFLAVGDTLGHGRPWASLLDPNSVVKAWWEKPPL